MMKAEKEAGLGDLWLGIIMVILKKLKLN